MRATNEDLAALGSDRRVTDWLPYWPQDPAEFLGCDLALPGDRVRTRYELGHVGSGVPEGTEGTVVTLGRGVRAHARHRELMALAAAEGRAPGAMEYEPLIDGEGPVVLWDGQDEPHWHPGQSDPTEVVSRYVPPHAVAGNEAAPKSGGK